ncbi:glucoamylase [Lewinellaceae bacterium SD302]|nr:glucoamylase [Lewinellaceae bacterium SD302]
MTKPPEKPSAPTYQQPYPDRYLPIEDYGVIGNLHTTALVSKQGNIDFMALPRFDSPTVFTRILDADHGGYFGVAKLSEEVRNTQLYLPDTNILLTRFLSSDGIAELTDFMPIAKNDHDFCIYRQLKCISGNHAFSFVLRPKFDYARQGCKVERHEKGYLLKDPSGEQPTLLLRTDVELEITEDGALIGELEMKEGELKTFILTLNEGQVHTDDFDEAFTECRQYWQNWISKCTYQGHCKAAVLRSALALKLLTSVQYGSTVAAATFGLPEGIGGERNWDYRYTWIRDTAFTMYAFLRLGYREEAAHFMEWLEKRCMDQLQLMYGVDGEKELPESELDHLEGYRQSKPVRIGNAAYAQEQMDIYGELIDTIYLFNQAGGSITYCFWKKIVGVVDYVIENWKKKDHGIWEVRNEKQRYLHSAVCCWVAVDRAMRIAEARSLPADLVKWQRVRDEMYTDIYENFYNNELGAYVQFKGSNTLDASALLMPLLRFVSSKEPRWLRTFAAIEKELSADVLIFRYKTEDGSDGLNGNEGSFTICSFWYVECLARIGRLDDAKLAFEKLLGYANHLGLMSEEIGLHGEQLGNFPQAFSHLAMISAAFQINKQK